ncbi:MAG: sigma-70 family RNA polymerase sigma factor [Planctomycetota bacterium]|nr:sigma-70 family RNA polymerase sigma factor [Planctomycetota bacterium]
MALSEVDRSLLDRCLAGEATAWRSFVDRFMGLVIHVVQHVARSRSLRLSEADRDDLVAEVFLTIVANDFAVLRHFRGQSSLATYLTVVARRVVVRAITRTRSAVGSPASQVSSELASDVPDPHPELSGVLSDREQVERLLDELQGAERDIVRLYHLEGRSYYEISIATGVPENSIGPLLSRAREKLRRVDANRT